MCRRRTGGAVEVLQRRSGEDARAEVHKSIRQRFVSRISCLAEEGSHRSGQGGKFKTAKALWYSRAALS
jgi:hypothetical protein